MSVLNFPCTVYSGIDSLEKIFQNDYESVLIISDGKLSQRSGALIKLKRKFDALLTRNEVIISENSDELFTEAKQYAEAHIPEAVIAVGDGAIIDCGCAVSKLTGIPFIAVIEVLPCALSEFDTLDPFLYRNPPKVCIIDPSFINISDSQKIAYSALGMAALALESAVSACDRYIAALAEKSFYEIYKNTLPAYRGEISARENLCGAMYAAYTAYINSFDYSWQSAAFRIASFFSKWNGEKISILAACAVHLAEFLYETESEKFSEISKRMELTQLHEIAPSFLIEELRRISAAMSVPFALKSFLIDEKEFSAACSELTEEDRDLFHRCMYGNVVFRKS